MEQLKHSFYIGNKYHEIDARAVVDMMTGKWFYRIMDNRETVDEGSSIWDGNLKEKISVYIDKLVDTYNISIDHDYYRRVIAYDLVPYSGDNWLSDCVYGGALTCHP